MKKNNNYSFLIVGKSQASTEASEGGFKRYIGVASSFVRAVNPKKAKLDELMGYESANEPEYVTEKDGVKEVHIHFIVETDSADVISPVNGENLGPRYPKVVTKLMFTLRNAPAYSKDGSTVQVIDDYGNSTYIPVQDAKEGKAALTSKGNPKKIDVNYRMARVGEADLIAFCRAFLCVPDAFNYINGSWVKSNPEEGKFVLERLKDFFNGDFSELQEVLDMQPNNKVKLLYGVRNSDGKQYQAVASRGELIMPNSAGASAYARVEKKLAEAKQNGAYSTTEFKVQELAEYTVEPTNLDQPAASADTSSNSDMPW